MMIDQYPYGVIYDHPDVIDARLEKSRLEFVAEVARFREHLAELHGYTICEMEIVPLPEVKVGGE